MNRLREGRVHDIVRVRTDMVPVTGLPVDNLPDSGFFLFLTSSNTTHTFDPV